MGTDIIRIVNGKPTINGQVIEFRKKGIVYLLIDVSSSMLWHDKLKLTIKGAGQFAADAMRTKQVGIILFGSTAELCCPATTDARRITANISAIEENPLVGGSTNMAAALEIALGQPFPIEIVVVMTDGAPDSGDAALNMAEMLREKGTDVLVIGTEDADWEFLGQLRSRPDLLIRTTDEGLGQAIIDSARLLRA